MGTLQWALELMCLSGGFFLGYKREGASLSLVDKKEVKKLARQGGIFWGYVAEPKAGSTWKRAFLDHSLVLEIRIVDCLLQ